jgi:hypothetical protein
VPPSPHCRSRPHGPTTAKDAGRANTTSRLADLPTEAPISDAPDLEPGQPLGGGADHLRRTARGATVSGTSASPTSRPSVGRRPDRASSSSGRADAVALCRRGADPDSHSECWDKR